MVECVKMYVYHILYTCISVNSSQNKYIGQKINDFKSQFVRSIKKISAAYAYTVHIAHRSNTKSDTQIGYLAYIIITAMATDNIVFSLLYLK